MERELTAVAEPARKLEVIVQPAAASVEYSKLPTLQAMLLLSLAAAAAGENPQVWLVAREEEAPVLLAKAPMEARQAHRVLETANYKVKADAGVVALAAV